MSDAPGTTESGHEQRDVTPRPIALAGAGLVVMVVAVVMLMHALLNHLASRESHESPVGSPLAGAYGRQEPPAPRLQTNPIADLQALRALDDVALHGYAWIDRATGVTRIPIERAKELLAERGLPVWQAPPSGSGAQGERAP